MSATSSGAAAGVVLGLVGVLLAQQFGYLDLTGLTSAVVDLAIGAVVVGIVGAVVGWALGKRYLARPPRDA
ncbi:MAG TPA: hypothetical protein VMG99_04550 [Thermoplasmata archaeon]|nr:hypothetical protein [Thermoplasmata archaeon]